MSDDKEDFKFSTIVVAYGKEHPFGEVIEKGALDHQDGKEVPLTWQFNPNLVIGKARIELSKDGKYIRAHGSVSHPELLITYLSGKLETYRNLVKMGVSVMRGERKTEIQEVALMPLTQSMPRRLQDERDQESQD